MKLYQLTLRLLLISILLWACAKVPISNRKQMNLLPESELMSMSLTSYNDFLKENPPMPESDPNVQQVKKVGKNISEAVTKYMTDNKMGKRIEGYTWEFNLVNDETVNAWCMPGGKVVVYKGLLPVTQDETSLALVMGHEVAHAVARHGNERMSQMMMAQIGGVALDVALSQKSNETRAIFGAAYGVGAQVGLMLPYSRLHETEADKMGLIFMAMAGYDPRKAPEFWNRMAALGGGKPPEILSTHPSDDTRQKNLNDFMPEAMKYYKVK
ncbi:MAG TPA: M48 family metallopeptidase [Bacteroidia bacterium]|nr:M48 family metallopeptidase [Bacteroidia bacterium]